MYLCFLYHRKHMPLHPCAHLEAPMGCIFAFDCHHLENCYDFSPFLSVFSVIWFYCFINYATFLYTSADKNGRYGWLARKAQNLVLLFITLASSFSSLPDSLVAHVFCFWNSWKIYFHCFFSLKQMCFLPTVTFNTINVLHLFQDTNVADHENKLTHGFEIMLTQIGCVLRMAILLGNDHFTIFRSRI